MKNTTEYQDLLRTLSEGGELSGADRIRLERLLAEDPDIVRLQERMERLDGLVRDDRTQLLKEARTDQLRAAVSTLSRSVPAGTAAAGTFSVGKIISGGLLLLLLAVGAWVLTDRGEGENVVVPASPETSVSVPTSAGSFDDEIPSVGNMREEGTGPIQKEDGAGRIEGGVQSPGKESASRHSAGPSEIVQSKPSGTEKSGSREEKQSPSVSHHGNIHGLGSFEVDKVRDSAKK